MFYGGLIVVLLYGGGGSSPIDEDFLITHDNLDILTHTSDRILVRGQ